LRFAAKGGTINPKMQLMQRWSAGFVGRTLALLNWLAAKRGTAAGRPEHLVTGERGEDTALLFLMQNGFTVVARRWNDGPLPGDLDLIAWKGDLLCFIEVKTRTTQNLAPAELAVDAHKRKTLRRLARQYLRQLPGPDRPETRFDIVTVYEFTGKPSTIRLIPGAFGWSERRHGHDD
jgi:putative endonuclease